MALSGLMALSDPDPSLEQYATPVEISSSILWKALENGDIIDRSVLELGCGGSPFALGALMLGSSSSIGVDIDPRCIELSKENLSKVATSGLVKIPESFGLLLGDLGVIGPDIPRCDTVFMNPPFGAQNRNADREFIKVACRKGTVIYAIHNGGTERFVRSEYGKMGAVTIEVENSRISIPHMFHFHNRERVSIDVILARVSMV